MRRKREQHEWFGLPGNLGPISEGRLAFPVQPTHAGISSPGFALGGRSACLLRRLRCWHGLWGLSAGLGRRPLRWASLCSLGSFVLCFPRLSVFLYFVFLFLLPSFVFFLPLFAFLFCFLSSSACYLPLLFVFLFYLPLLLAFLFLPSCAFALPAVFLFLLPLCFVPPSSPIVVRGRRKGLPDEVLLCLGSGDRVVRDCMNPRA